MKHDVHEFAASRDSGSLSTSPTPPSQAPTGNIGPQSEQYIALTPIQSQMFKVMTRSLSIPHFLYADEIDVTQLSGLRLRLNAQSANSQKLSILPFIIKAISLALDDFPVLNARIEAGDGSSPPQIVIRQQHNISIAMDTPQGLLVPNIKDIASKSITDIASELSRLRTLALSGKLSVRDLTGGTISVSNIGSIGGTYVSPVLLQSEVAILGIGKTKSIPAFDEQDRVVRKNVVNFSWSADHRIVDGATMARMAELVRGYIEEPGMMMARLK